MTAFRSEALPATIYADLVGKPFLRDARGPSAYDCLGLAIEISRRRGCLVPDYDSTPDELARQYREGGGVLGVCSKIEQPCAGAIVLLRSPDPSERHMGVMTDRWWMVHACEGTGRVIRENLLRSLWMKRVLGFYEIQPAVRA